MQFKAGKGQEGKPHVERFHETGVSSPTLTMTSVFHCSHTRNNAETLSLPIPHKAFHWAKVYRT